MLPKEKTKSELQHVTRINKVALYVCVAHLPLFLLVAWLCHTSLTQALVFGLLLILGPAIGTATIKNPRRLSLLYGFTAMGLGALLVHLGQGPMQIEMHFHFFAALALLAVWGNPLVIWIAALTVVLQHGAFCFFLPASVFNYEASFWVILVHGSFVAVESVAAAFMARSFFDNVIGLEKIVENKTQTIRNILDNVSFGLFICDAKLRVQEGYSLSSEKFFRRMDQEMAGTSLPELLMLTHREGDHLTALYTQIFEDIAPEELSLGQLPNRFHVHGKNISLTGSAIRDASGTVVSVLFCIADISALVAAEAEVSEARTLLKILRSKDRFQSFVDDCVLRFGRMRTALLNHDQESVRLGLHTMKGNFGVYGLISLAGIIHDLENRSAVEASDLDMFETHFKNFLVKHYKALGIEYGVRREEVFTLTAHDLEVVEHNTSLATHVIALKKDLRDFYARIRMKPAAAYLGPIDEFSNQLARRFGKKIRFEMQGGSTLVPSALGALMETLPHLIRNAIDHGIEPARDRGTKPKEALLSVYLSEDDKCWAIEVKDDGRGIDVFSLSSKAVELGKISKAEAEAMSDKQKFALLFLADVTTAAAVTDVSGRGIGMAAVAAAVAELNGHIDVTSRRHEGTTVSIRIPKIPLEQSERLSA